MSRNSFKIIAVALLCSLLALAFVWTDTLAGAFVTAVEAETSYAAQPEVKTSTVQGAGALKRFGGFKVETRSDGDASPRVAVAGDFDADGFQDVLVAHNDRVVLHRGNINAYAPQTEEAWEAIRDGRFISPFERKTRSTGIPVAADFVLAGDFNRDSHLDAAVASRGGSVLYILEGDGSGNFPNLRTIEIGSVITSLAAGDVNRADGLLDLIVGTSNEAGFGLRVFSGLGDVFASEPLYYDLPSRAEAITVGQLNQNEFADIAVGTDAEVIIFSGTDSLQTDVLTIPEMQRVPAPGGVKSIVAGDLMPDRDNRTELALLSQNGTIRILARGTLDTRPVSKKEHLVEQVLEYQAKGYPIPDRILAQLSKKDLSSRPSRAKSGSNLWAQADTVSVAAPDSLLSSQSILTIGQLSGGLTADLIVLDQAGATVSVIPFERDLSGVDRENTSLSFAGRREPKSFEVTGSPVIALSLKLNHDTREDLLVFQKGEVEPAAIVSATLATFTVTTAVDDIDNNLADNLCNGPSGCTLRAAIMQANRTPGDDTIMINAGINPTISRGQPDNDGQGTNDQASGDLDITCVITDPTTGACDLPLASNDNDLSIIGAAGGNTISAGVFTNYPVDGGGNINTDRVFDVGQDGIFGGGFGGSTGVAATFTNLTIQNGYPREALNTVLGGGNYAFGGGIRFDGFRSGGGHSTLTLTNSTINNNQADNAGGGVYHIFGSHSASGSTYSNNITHAGEGGGLFFGAATTASNVSITNSTFTANEARQGTVFGTFTANADGGGLRFSTDLNTLTVTTTNFTNNIAQEDGGAIKTLNGAATVTGGTMTGNTARRHGGVSFGDQDTAGGARFLTFSGSTMRNNTANSDSAGTGLAAGAGGAIFRDRGVLNITNTIIGGTGASEPNTATDGGGVAHFFTVDSAPGNTSNQTTINFNGGSINGNNATANGTTVGNNGGGVYFDSALFDINASVLNIGQTTATAITGNRAENHGGGIHTSNGALTNLKDMVLRSNLANSDSSGAGDGGGLYQNLGTTTFTGTLTIGGSGFANSAVNGGGVRNAVGTINIPSNASITHNTATGTGGGLSNAGTLSALVSPTIQNNTATGNGGGLHNTSQLGAITSPNITSNSGATGGGIFSSTGPLSVTGGTVSSNVATVLKGGGIHHSGTSASVISGVTINGNTGSGVLITGTTGIDVKNNTITNNTGDGITKTSTGAGTSGSHFDSNIIHTNGELGIDLSDNAVTPNDINDVDTGPNNLQNFPVINWVRRTDGIGNVTLNSPNGKYRIQYYKNATCDPSGHGEGELLMTSQVVDIVSGNTLTFATPALAFDPGVREQITATATHDANGNSNFDDDGSTSEFSACRQVNTLPTFTAVQTPSRQQGSPATNSQIATVTDPDQTLNTLVVTVDGGATATVNGVTVSNIVVDASGNVTADIVASCTATNASFTLRVTDTPGEFNETTLNVTVTPNTPPTVGNYPNTTVNLGSSGTVVTPDAAPADNGTVSTLTAAAPGFTGSFVGNTTSGTVTVNSAGPSGTYTVTVTATDNCGATTTTTFQLVVNAPPTITPQAGNTRQQGSPVSNTQIGVVNDIEDAEDTLAVTVNGGASATDNGVTISNIVVSAGGFVTADIVASCPPSSNATFTLTVTDSLGATDTDPITVTVTPNTPPTVGTYPTTSVNASAGTTVTPASAPADNGSITNATVIASAGYTGTLSVDQTTGVVTVSNANPVGSYTITVTYTDNCGATTSPTFTLNVVDVTPPDTTITANPTDPSGPNVSFSFTGTDSESGVASFECELDGGGFTACTSPKTYTGLAQGSHTFQVRAIDNATNVDPTPASFTWNVDATPPDTTINTNPTNPSNSGNASFTFSGTDTGGSTVASFECKLDVGAFAACSSPQNYTGLSDGSHTFQVRAIDGVGNVDANPASYSWTIDATAPDTSITANPTNPSGSNVSFSFTGTDSGTGVASFECQLDGGGFAACTSPQAYTGLTDGSHTFQVRAIDNVGNADGSPASFTWIADTAPPDTTFTANPTDPSGPNVSFSFTGSDAGSGVAGFECDLDGGGFAACTSPKTYTGLTQGSHTFMVRAIDNVGNVDPSAASFTWNVDATAPDTTINTSPPNPSNSGNASFAFSGIDTGGSTVASFECDLDGGGFTACTSPQNYTGLSDGSHTFQVRAVDGVGNVDASPASYTWVIDTTGPDTTITANPTNPSNSSSASFSFTGTDTGGTGVASFECQLDGGGFAACTSPQTYNSLSDGSHTFQVRAIDNAGNSDGTPAAYTWVVDTAPPDTSITANPSNPTNSTSASFSFTGTDTGTGVASFECKLDGGAFVPCTSPQNYAGLADGSHTFQVRAVDGIGNVDPTPASYTWTVDTDPPDVTINQAAGQSDPANGMGVTIHFTAVFNEPVTGFTSSDVTIGGTAGATTVVVTQIAPMNGTTFDVAVSGMTTGGTVTASIGANKAFDAAGNGNTASTSTDNTVTYVPNTPPTANPDSYSTVQDTPLTVPAPGVLGNDSDPDAGNTITAVLVSGPTNAASFTLNADGSFSYTPTAGFTGTDSFTYKARDNFNADSNTVTVTLNVQYKFSWFSYSGLLFNEQALNQVTAGSDVPVRFTLYGNKGNPYSSPPTSQQINCSTQAPIGAATVINRYMPDPFYSSLYDFYQTTWRTQTSWKFTCRRLTLHLNDGTTRSLNFYFK